jgi:hypothetical protein
MSCVMAQEVANIVLTAVQPGKDGYLRVDYGQLGMKLMRREEWALATSADASKLPRPADEERI